MEALGLSNRTLWEFDCIEYRQRVLSFTIYPERNLEGTIKTSSDSVEEWAYIAPVTVGEDVADTVC